MCFGDGPWVVLPVGVAVARVEEVLLGQGSQCPKRNLISL